MKVNKNLKLIPIILLGLGVIGRVIVGIQTSIALGDMYHSSGNNFFNNHYDLINLINVLSVVFLVLGVLSLVYVLSNKNILLTIAATLVIVVIGFVFHSQQNSKQKNTLNDCLHAIGYNPQVTHVYVTRSSNSEFSQEVSGCYSTSGVKETFINNQLVAPSQN